MALHPRARRGKLIREWAGQGPDPQPAGSAPLRLRDREAVAVILALKGSSELRNEGGRLPSQTILRVVCSEMSTWRAASVRVHTLTSTLAEWRTLRPCALRANLA